MRISNDYDDDDVETIDPSIPLVGEGAPHRSPPPPSSSSVPAPSNWVGWKERGKRAFEGEDYAAALNAYTQALQPDMGCPRAEQQIMLSNIVACRLKIGGRPQAEAAVEAAKRCVAMNDRWAKGHVRLASAYIALGDVERSNDACRALQRALQLDPGNPAARAMLVRELRRDHRAGGRPSDVVGGVPAGSPPPPSAPPHDLDDHDYRTSPGGDRSSRQTSSGPQRRTPNDRSPRPRPAHPTDATAGGNHDNVDDAVSWHDRLQFHVQRAKLWYMDRSEGVQTLLKVLLALVVLYVAFGGRFGLEYLTAGGDGPRRSRAGNYRAGNVYEEFYQERAGGGSHRWTSHGGGGGGGSHRGGGGGGGGGGWRDSSPGDSRDRRYDPYEGTSRGGGGWNRGAGWSGPSFGGGLFGGTAGLPNMLILAGIAYVAHRNGVNPFQALFFANVAMGGRHRPGGFGGAGMRFGRAAFGRGGGFRNRPGMGGMGGW